MAEGAMLTAAQVAPMLGISARAVYELAAEGGLRHYKFGRAIRFEAADVLSCPATLPASAARAGHTPARVLREVERLRLRVPEDVRPPSALTADQRAIVERRVRRMRMAPWADPKAIRALHHEARRLAAETGMPHHVDHVIPLQGDFVSGLHVETNMQILTGSENSRKCNRFEVE